jgi:hypothetical protein
MSAPQVSEFKITLLSSAEGAEEWKGEILVNGEVLFTCKLPAGPLNREQTYRTLSREFDKARFDQKRRVQ